jgi:drug/metabolite transporter (DMT)-like permease
LPRPRGKGAQGRAKRRVNRKKCGKPPRMKPASNPHLKTYFLIFLIVIFAPVGNVLLSKGMKREGALQDYAPVELAHFFEHALQSPLVWLGIASLLSFFVAYMIVLSWADYSYVQPASAAAYVVVALLGYFVLGESVSVTRWAGVLVICSGVYVVGRTPPRTTEPN